MITCSILILFYHLYTYHLVLYILYILYIYIYIYIYIYKYMLRAAQPNQFGSLCRLCLLLKYSARPITPISVNKMCKHDVPNAQACGTCGTVKSGKPGLPTRYEVTFSVGNGRQRVTLKDVPGTHLEGTFTCVTQTETSQALWPSTILMIRQKSAYNADCLERLIVANMYLRKL